MTYGRGHPPMPRRVERLRIRAHRWASSILWKNRGAAGISMATDFEGHTVD